MSSGSSFGSLLRLSTFGESHGKALGGIIDGFPPGFEVDTDRLQAFLAKRKPGQSKIVTQRKEDDEVRFLSGIFEGKTTGTPIGFIIENQNQKSKDYSHIKDVSRPSHADETYKQKYGHRDYRGGGRSSARETVARVVAGGLAIQYLETLGIHLNAFVDQVGSLRMPNTWMHETQLQFSEEQIEHSPTRCPDKHLAAEMEQLISETKKQGDTIGGAISCQVIGVPTGLGEPVFEKLHANLGKAMLSINAVKGFEYGAGFEAIGMNGSEHNDAFKEDGSTTSNFSGGIQGGISNGMPIHFRVAFKPVATLLQKTEGLHADGKIVEMQGKGRHDACVVPRAVPIVEAMCALTLLDAYLHFKAYQ